MDIKAISNANPKKTYQGSVSAADMSPISVEGASASNNAPAVGANESTQPKAQAAAKNGEETATVTPGKDTIKKAVDEINKNVKNSEAIFGIHEATNRVTIKIVDKESKEIIKEYPPEKTLDMIAKVWEMAGLMVDEKR